MKTCPDCNGDGVVEKARTMNSDARHAVGMVLYLTTATTKTS